MQNKNDIELHDGDADGLLQKPRSEFREVDSKITANRRFDSTVAGESSRPSEKQGEKREYWGKQAEFILSTIGYCVSIGNIWRFPYLTLKNEGGVFLIPYLFFMIICGIPLFYLEVAIGQYSGRSVLALWNNLCPLFRGIGWAMCIVSTIVNLTLMMLVAWVVYYFVASLTNELPWKTCGNPWNTPLCRSSSPVNFSSNLVNFTTSNSDQQYVLFSNRSMTPAEEFWRYQVLGISAGAEQLGGVRWQLLLCSLAAWIISFLCLFKGVKSVGKVVYFTVIAPYVMMLVLLVRAVTLPGAVDGLLFYVTPKWSKLLGYQIWVEASIQVFYSLGPAWGGLISLASHNKFHNNCFRDALMIPLFDCGTAIFGGFVIFPIIGHLAYTQNTTITQVIQSGPGLAFISYPEAAAELPVAPLWCALFFFMLLTLGIDSAFGLLETAQCALIDAYPAFRKRKVSLALALHALCFLLSVILTTRAGIYFWQVIDWYASTFTVVIVAFLECIVLLYVYNRDGALYSNFEEMLGSKPGIVWRVSWKFITPLILLVMFIMTIINFSAPVFESYRYPSWMTAIGCCFALTSILPIPICAIIEISKAEGGLLNRIRSKCVPIADWKLVKTELQNGSTDPD